MYVHAQENPKLTPAKVFKLVRKDAPFKEKVSFGDVERGLQSNKAKSLPTLPNSVEEFIEALDSGENYQDLVKNYRGSVKIENSEDISSVILGHPMLIDKFKGRWAVFPILSLDVHTACILF